MEFTSFKDFLDYLSEEGYTVNDETEELLQIAWDAAYSLGYEEGIRFMEENSYN